MWFASSRTTSLTGRSPSAVGVGNADVPASTFRFVNAARAGRRAFRHVEDVTLRRRASPRCSPSTRSRRDPCRPGRRRSRSGTGSASRREVELSIRCHVTVAGSDASALCVTKMRPAEVAAQSVPVVGLVAGDPRDRAAGAVGAVEPCRSGRRPVRACRDRRRAASPSQTGRRAGGSRRSRCWPPPVDELGAVRLVAGDVRRRVLRHVSRGARHRTPRCARRAGAPE